MTQYIYEGGMSPVSLVYGAIRAPPAIHTELFTKRYSQLCTVQ